MAVGATAHMVVDAPVMSVTSCGDTSGSSSFEGTVQKTCGTVVSVEDLDVEQPQLACSNKEMLHVTTVGEVCTALHDTEAIAIVESEGKPTVPPAAEVGTGPSASLPTSADTKVQIVSGEGTSRDGNAAALSNQAHVAEAEQAVDDGIVQPAVSSATLSDLGAVEDEKLAASMLSSLCGPQLAASDDM
eukprot:TRINITY_DN65355_c0_g1_i1.p1 TRINITY_DN65355_c0_g1~~TRINITY_DN65355_c0_g1_i1.p1  ORF type:complete len:217 (+),score=62.28 TRINITY_DN65355_c0_g1_i1:90-653(+)